VPLDPQAAAWLERVAALGLPAYDEVTPAEARLMLERGTPELAGPAEAVARVEEIDAGGVRARLYEPDDAGQGVLVWFHGGGWVIGSLETHEPLCRALANRSRHPVLSVDYRLAPEHVHPAAVDDAWAAARWAVAQYGHVAVGGDSAGGHLAAVTARRARDSGLALALQVLVVPVTDCGFDTKSHLELAEGYGLTGRVMRWFWELYLPGLNGADDPDVSPLRAPDLQGLAPALVITAEYDPLRDEGEAYAARLREAGVDVAARRYEGMIHGFLRMGAVLERSGDAVDEIAAAVGSALADATIPDRAVRTGEIA
jgi:acetyl esterase